MSAATIRPYPLSARSQVVKPSRIVRGPDAVFVPALGLGHGAGPAGRRPTSVPATGPNRPGRERVTGDVRMLGVPAPVDSDRGRTCGIVN